MFCRSHRVRLVSRAGRRGASTDLAPRQGHALARSARCAGEVESAGGGQPAQSFPENPPQHRGRATMTTVELCATPLMVLRWRPTSRVCAHMNCQTDRGGCRPVPQSINADSPKQAQSHHDRGCSPAGSPSSIQVPIKRRPRSARPISTTRPVLRGLQRRLLSARKRHTGRESWRCWTSHVLLADRSGTDDGRGCPRAR